MCPKDCDVALVREGLASDNGTLRSSSLEGTHVFLCGLFLFGHIGLR